MVKVGSWGYYILLQFLLFFKIIFCLFLVLLGLGKGKVHLSLNLVFQKLEVIAVRLEIRAVAFFRNFIWYRETSLILTYI